MLLLAPDYGQELFRDLGDCLRKMGLQGWPEANPKPFFLGEFGSVG